MRKKELADIDILSLDNSDIDLEEEIPPPNDDDVALSHFDPAQSKKWIRNKTFVPPHTHNLVKYSDSVKILLEYFKKYIVNDFFQAFLR